MAESDTAEFNWFEGLRKKLTAAFFADGYPRQKAEEAGFFLAQAIRDVPALLHLLDEAEPHTQDEIMNAVHMVLANRPVLQEAASILLHEGRTPQPE